MAPRASSKIAATKVPAKMFRTRRQTKEQQLRLQQRIRKLGALPPTFRCWFCVGEKHLEEQEPNTRTVPICHNCSEYYRNVLSERDAAATQPTVAASSSALPSRIPTTTPTPAGGVITSPPVRLAVVINQSKGLKKKIILKFKVAKKPGVPTSNEGREEHNERRKIKLRSSMKMARIFLSLPKRGEEEEEEKEKIFLRFLNPLKYARQV